MTTQTTEPRPMKPYLINAVLDYCRDTGTTPYVMVAVDHACRVPQEYVRDGRIIFDLTDEAVNRLAISDTELTFQARFGENNEIFDVLVPLNRIIAVTPLECQQFARRGARGGACTARPRRSPPDARKVMLGKQEML